MFMGELSLLIDYHNIFLFPCSSTPPLHLLFPPLLLTCTWHSMLWEAQYSSDWRWSISREILLMWYMHCGIYIFDFLNLYMFSYCKMSTTMWILGNGCLLVGLVIFSKVTWVRATKHYNTKKVSGGGGVIWHLFMLCHSLQWEVLVSGLTVCHLIFYLQHLTVASKSPLNFLI